MSLKWLNKTLNDLKRKNIISINEIKDLRGCSTSEAYNIMIFLIENHIVKEKGNGIFESIVNEQAIDDCLINLGFYQQKFSVEEIKSKVPLVNQRVLALLYIVNINNGISIIELKEKFSSYYDAEHCKKLISTGLVSNKEGSLISHISKEDVKILTKLYGLEEDDFEIRKKHKIKLEKRESRDFDEEDDLNSEYDFVFKKDSYSHKRRKKEEQEERELELKQKEEEEKGQSKENENIIDLSQIFSNSNKNCINLVDNETKVVHFVNSVSDEGFYSNARLSLCPFNMIKSILVFSPKEDVEKILASESFYETIMKNIDTLDLDNSYVAVKSSYGIKRLNWNEPIENQISEEYICREEKLPYLTILFCLFIK